MAIKISVVIPAYNAGLFIGKALDSIREQSILPFEVLITNDGSTDNTEAIIKEYIRQYPNFKLKLESQKNRGIGSARNNGLFRASGDFVAFLDADDYWYPNKLEEVVDVLKINHSVDVVYHNEIQRDDTEAKLLLKYGSIIGDPYQDLLFSGNKLSTSATVVRRSLVIKIGGFSEDMNFNSAEDYELWLKLASFGANFYYLDKVLGEYWKISSSITTRIEYHANNSFKVFEHHLYLMCKDGSISKLKYKIILWARIGKCYQGIGRNYYFSDMTAKAIKFYLKSMIKWPFYWKTYAGLVLCLKNYLL